MVPGADTGASADCRTHKAAPMNVGIVSLWWNHTELLPEFVRMMKGQPWDRLILVDNASTPEAGIAYDAAIERFRSGASVMHLETNSVLDGWNSGMNALDTDVVVQMANDVVMTDPRWLGWG